MAIAGICLPSMAIRPGNYYHVFPTYAQGEKVVFKGTVSEGGSGRPMLDLFPPHWRPNFIGGEMMVELHIPPGDRLARYQVVGADDEKSVSRLVGTNPFGIIYDEAAQMTLGVRDYLSPALTENKGWELLISTPRGKNWYYDLLVEAMGMPDRWFHQWLRRTDCRRDAPGEDGKIIVSDEEFDQAIRDGMSREKAEQEFDCSVDAPLEGTVFGEVLRAAHREGRITRLIRDVNAPVGVCLDIGHSDGTAIWFYQQVRDETRFLDYYFARGKNMADIVATLRARPYVYGRVVLPWDADAETFSSTEGTPLQYFRRMHFSRVVVPEGKLRVEAGNEMVRRAFAKFVFNEEPCTAKQEGRMPGGLECVANYHYKVGEGSDDYSKEPVHDIYSHGADALRNGVIGGLGPMDFPRERRPEDRHSQCTYNPVRSFANQHRDLKTQDRYAGMRRY
jgi:hypothetical protein